MPGLVDQQWVFDQTGISLNNDHPVLYEGAPAGYINPRRLIKAQNKLAGSRWSDVR